MKGHLFNIDNGYLEGLCRGFKNGILRQPDYLNLVQCETLDGKSTYYSRVFIYNAQNTHRIIFEDILEATGYLGRWPL